MVHRSSRFAASACAALTLAGCVMPGVTHRSGRFEAGTLVGGDPDRKAVLLQHTDGSLTWLPIGDISKVDHAGASLWRGGLATTVVGTSLALLIGLVAPPGQGLSEEWRIGGLLGGAMLAAAGGMLVGFGADQEAVSQAHQRRAMVPARWSIDGAPEGPGGGAAPTGAAATEKAAAFGSAEAAAQGELRGGQAAPMAPASKVPGELP